MAAPNLGREPEPEEALVALLKNEPFRVKFFEAVRLLRRLLPARRPVGHFVPPRAEVARFVANPSLEFPASEIQSLEFPDDPSVPIKIMVNFMGLAAPNGVLPEPYTELIIERSQKKVGKDRSGKDRFDNGFRDFLDIFNHRFISLFYRVWEKHHFYVPYEEHEADQLTPMLFSFIGLGTKGLLGRQVIKDQVLAYYAGLLSQRPRSAQALQQILEDYFDVPMEVEQFVGRWIPLPLRDQTQFEDAESMHVQLSFGAVAGDEIWDQQSMVRIKVGPLSLSQYLDFLPTPQGKAYPALKSLLKFYSNDQLDFQVQLVLKEEETPALELTGEPWGHAMLGWVTWIKNADLGRNPAETILEI
jgi:type VI secretion system protein ImpH